VSTAVSHVDLLPTFFELAGIGDEPGLMGRSLAGAFEGKALAEQPVWADGTGSQALIDGRWKAIVNGDGRAAHIPGWKSPGPIELYDLANDPTEQRNLAQSRPEDAKRLGDRIAATQSDHRLLAKAVATSHSELPDDVRERLKSLGYLE
jgi:arylsulfatase